LSLLFLSFLPHAAWGQSADYAKAEALVRNHQWDDGLALLLPLLKSEPRNLKALNLAGLALIGKGDTEHANEYLKKAIAIDPAFTPALKNLSINEFNSQQYAAAEKHLLAAQKELPGDPVVNLYLGEIAYRQKQYARAVAALGRARDLVSQNPNASAHLAISYLQTAQQQKAFAILDGIQPEQIEPRSQFELGLALEQLGSSARSLPYLEAVHRRYPDAYDIGFDLMLGYLAAGTYQTAIEVGRDLIARGHETAELNNILAEAYAGNHEIQSAVDALRRAIALDPQDEDNYLDFAALCMNQRSLQAGMTVIEVALKSHPKSDRLIFMRGVLHATQDEFELAEKDFRLSAELAPRTNLGFVGLGVTYLETGNAKQAIQILRGRLRQKPNDASLLYLLGEGLLRSGATPGDSTYLEAQRSLEKSVRLNPKLCLPHVSLGTIYLDEDRPGDAVVQLEQARAIDPKERSAYSHLAVAYRRIGEVDKSKAVLTALKELIEQERRSTREKMKPSSEEESPEQSSETHPDGASEKH
jgi:predicted Zn-dependent protease